jgi:AcrR family transcriptional regulator
MLVGMADAMADKGYVATSVADVIARAGVSRETFYQQFSSKLDCFMHAFEAAGNALVSTLAADIAQSGSDLSPGADRDPATRVARFDHVFAAYLHALATHSAYARLFLVEAYAAGPEAIQARARLQRRIVAALAELLGVTTDQGRFACEVLVAAVGQMVTVPLVSNDVEALYELHAPVVDLVRRALAPDGQLADPSNASPTAARPTAARSQNP